MHPFTTTTSTNTTSNDKKSSVLLPPLSTIDPFTKAVPNLITYFEGLDTTLEELSSTPPGNMSRIPPPFPSPFSALRLSLSTSCNRPQRTDTAHFSTDSTASSAPSSVSASPQSSLRGAAFSRSRTWNTSRARSRSPQSMHSYTNSPVLLSRRPSAIDLALLEEESLSHNVRGVGLGLGMMEPRPVVPVAVAPSSSGNIFESMKDEELEQRQPFVMGGILEVMEGRS